MRALADRRRGRPPPPPAHEREDVRVELERSPNRDRSSVAVSGQSADDREPEVEETNQEVQLRETAVVCGVRSEWFFFEQMLPSVYAELKGGVVVVTMELEGFPGVDGGDGGGTRAAGLAEPGGGPGVVPQAERQGCARCWCGSGQPACPRTRCGSWTMPSLPRRHRRQAASIDGKLPALVLKKETLSWSTTMSMQSRERPEQDAPDHRLRAHL